MRKQLRALVRLWKSNVFRQKLHDIIFGADTKAGIMFDVMLFVAIILSVIVVMLETVQEFQTRYWYWFYVLEWIFTIFFTLEYIIRLYIVRKPWNYATSFFGIVDLLSILPTYLSVLFLGAQSLLVIRILRLIRIFRIFKLWHFLNEGNILLSALKASLAKIIVFITFVLLMVTVIGSVMYIIEGGQPDTTFTSIPRSIYWAIVTLTTVGYGDITPTTNFGQFISAVVMMLGYAVIAVPTGIVSVELFHQKGKPAEPTAFSCRNCGGMGHDANAEYCKHCGDKLNRNS